MKLIGQPDVVRLLLSKSAFGYIPFFNFYFQQSFVHGRIRFNDATVQFALDHQDATFAVAKYSFRYYVARLQDFF